MMKSRVLSLFLVMCLALASCTASTASPPLAVETPEAVSVVEQASGSSKVSALNFQPSYPTRPVYEPGELVEYVAQTGDTLPGLAAHFNTTVAEIQTANSFIPGDATTMPPGMPMQIPIYYLPFWGNPYQILPDSLFINGPAQVGFNVQEWVDSSEGWLKWYHGWVSGERRSGAKIVELVARNYSVSPRLLLALLEFSSGAVTLSAADAAAKFPGYDTYPLGYTSRKHRGLYLQLVWAVNTLNYGYYGWRDGSLNRLEVLDSQHPDTRREEYPDPWQNAATVALQYCFSQLLSQEAYQQAIAAGGFAATYQALYGDPWTEEAVQGHIPGSLYQPEFALPFQARKVWAFTGGPHTGWGEGDPLSALDFAPPSVVGGCTTTDEWATAVAPGVVARSDPATVILDLDGDGDERTGWIVFYLHIATEDRVPLGAELQTGDPIGHPSCEGGRATGTHIHISRKYNGEWIPAEGPLAFNLEGWIAQNGPIPYAGTLTRFSQTVTACVCSDYRSHIESASQP